MSDFITKLSELIDPEVMGDMVSARIPKKLRVAPFAKIDDTLQGVPGDTITVPAYTYIGDASDVAEGGEVAIEKMTTSTRKATIKKAMKGIGLTDEAVLSGYGNPVGEANTQLAQAIAAKVDNDCMDALQTASLIYDAARPRSATTPSLMRLTCLRRRWAAPTRCCSSTRSRSPSCARTPTS